ncbi:endonuclease/exonuclease/phosphatase family protein [Corynebacterium sp. TAE3-ERU12]|uniref:exodeoxyribonuclease III n=1 Tax=Corynebacterium sp. TAE3-ERU12 TaxID=2849491 RepID=UPI001C45A8F7|nr:exodeoxyribonuclease III [Corynebacterium sp. TAE3-ERU12]MBV7294754.1 endonuclease/exonuclease/phosphatase family protein [Corynebacterium sp. TAE3-ERU12]
MSLTIATVNVNGIRAAVKKRHEDNPGMLAWLSHTPSDIVLLQEVRATPEQAEKALAPAIADGWHWEIADNELAKGRAGVGLLSKVPLADVQVGFGADEFDRSGRFISARVEAAHSGLDEDVTVGSLYLPSGAAQTEKQDEKYRFLDVFGPYLDALAGNGNVVVGGDWNICHREQDLKNWKGNRTSSGFLPQERGWMDSVFSAWPDAAPQDSQAQASEKELAAGSFTDGSSWTPPTAAQEPKWFDVARRLRPDEDGPYTWWTYRGKAFDTNAGWRIDYQAATKSMLDRAASATVDRAAAYNQRWSDHSPLVVTYS